MNAEIALFLIQDGLTNGAIYALLALALVLVFAVTRVIFIPQGEFVSYGALTLASLQLGKLPGTAWLLLGAGLAVAAVELVQALRLGAARRIPAIVLRYIVIPALLLWLAWWAAPQKPALTLQVLLTLALVVPLGPLVYRLAYQPLANASVLVLLIISVAVHFAMTGLGLVFFGAEGSRTPPFSDAQWKLGVLNITGQSLWVMGASLALIVGLLLFFEHTIYGKALRATAINRVGARIVGIRPAHTGTLAFLLASLLGAISGILISPVTTLYYNSGFIIGLKAFVGAIIGGLVSYPGTAIGALLVGILESFASFWNSSFKEVMVFGLLIPVLLWRSLSLTHVDEEDAEIE